MNVQSMCTCTYMSSYFLCASNTTFSVLIKQTIHKATFVTDDKACLRISELNILIMIASCWLRWCMGTLAGGPGHWACMACMCMKVIMAWYAHMHAMLCNTMTYHTLPLFDGIQCAVCHNSQYSHSTECTYMWSLYAVGHCVPHPSCL